MTERRPVAISDTVSLATTVTGPAADAEPPDAELVATARQDPRAFDVLYRRHVTAVYRYARSRVATAQDAEDVTAAAFIEALTGLSGYEEQGRFVGWLFTIARRQVLAHRRHTRQQADLDEARAVAEVVTAVEDERDLLARALARLSEDRREAITLRYYGGLKVNEVAEVLGKGESATKMLIHRGLLQLKDLLRADPRG